MILNLKKIYYTFNWETNEKGFKVCLQGRVFSQFIKDKYQRKGKELQTNKYIVNLINVQDVVIY